MYKIPDKIYEFFEQNPTVGAASVARQFQMPERTIQRYRRHWLTKEAVPVLPEPRVISRCMEKLDQTTDDFDVDAFLEEARRQSKRLEQLDPVLTQDTFTFSGNSPIGVAFISCMHLGGRYTAYKEFEKIYEQLLDIPHLYVVSLGDDIEGFPSYFRDTEAVYDQILDPVRQRAVLESILEPLVAQNKLLCGCSSQHGDKWVRSRTGENPIKGMYMGTFKVPFFDGSAYIEFRVGEQIYYIALSHVFPGDSQWNPVHAQRKAATFRFPMADVVVQGDKHTTAFSLVTSFMDEYLMGNRPSPYTWLIQSGTAKTGPDKYTITRWPMGNFGWPVAIFYPDVHDVFVDMDLNRVRKLLDVNR